MELDIGVIVAQYLREGRDARAKLTQEMSHLQWKEEGAREVYERIRIAIEAAATGQQAVERVQTAGQADGNQSTSPEARNEPGTTPG